MHTNMCLRIQQALAIVIVYAQFYFCQENAETKTLVCNEFNIGVSSKFVSYFGLTLKHLLE